MYMYSNVETPLCEHTINIIPFLSTEAGTITSDSTAEEVGGRT